MSNMRRLLQILAVATTIAQLPLQFVQLTDRPTPTAPTEGTAWDTHARTYCKKSGLSVPLTEDDNYGFGLTSSQCRARCDASADCKFYSYGKWVKGMSSTFGGHYGEMRCQTYSLCDMAELEGMSVFEKPSLPTPKAPEQSPDQSLDLPVLGVLAALMALNMLVVQPSMLPGSNLLFPCSFLASALSAWVMQNASKRTSLLAGPAFLCLSVAHILNSACLLGLASLGVEAEPKEEPKSLSRSDGRRRPLEAKDEGDSGDEGDDRSEPDQRTSGKKITMDLTKSRSAKASDATENKASVEPKSEDTDATEQPQKAAVAAKQKPMGGRLGKAGFTKANTSEDLEFEVDLSNVGESFNE